MPTAPCVRSWWARFAWPTLRFLIDLRGYIMGDDSLSTDELNDRIAILEDNIRQLIEQAAAASGEQNESRIADRISQQNEELDHLLKVREARQKK